MKINAEGIAIIKQFEGCELKAYKCPAGVWTIGYGHTGKDVTPGLVISATHAERLLLRDVESFEAGVSELVKVELTDNQFSALVSLAFNIGLGRFKNSTLLRKLNQGKYADAAQQFNKWVYAAGVKLGGLVKRRAAERELFESY